MLYIDNLVKIKQTLRKLYYFAETRPNPAAIQCNLVKTHFDLSEIKDISRRNLFTMMSLVGFRMQHHIFT